MHFEPEWSWRWRPSGLWPWWVWWQRGCWETTSCVSLPDSQVAVSFCAFPVNRNTNETCNHWRNNSECYHNCDSSSCHNDSSHNSNSWKLIPQFFFTGIYFYTSNPPAPPKKREGRAHFASRDRLMSGFGLGGPQWRTTVTRTLLVRWYRAAQKFCTEPALSAKTNHLNFWVEWKCVHLENHSTTKWFRFGLTFGASKHAGQFSAMTGNLFFSANSRNCFSLTKANGRITRRSPSLQ